MNVFEDIALPFVLSVEKGYWDDPNAGPTNFGIVQTNYDAYTKYLNLKTKSVKVLNAQEVKEFYWMMYWCMAKCQSIPYWKLQLIHFDSAVLSGVGQAIRFLQKALKVIGLYTGNIDGDYGPLTQEALTKVISYEALSNIYLDIRVNFLELLHDPIMEKGWTNRINLLKERLNQPE